MSIIKQDPAISGANKRGIIAWCIYDWGISAYFSVILTFVFATYFTKTLAKNPIIGTAKWGDTIALAGVAIALLSPIVGAIADHEGRRKPWLGAFVCLTIISTALLWFAQPATHNLIWILGCVALGNIGLEIAQVFYNAMLRDIAPAAYLGRISGWGWGLGYAGGVTCLLIVLFGFIQGHIPGLHLDTKVYEQVRICAPMVALWVFVFVLPLLFFTPDRAATGIPVLTAIKRGVSTLIGTLRKVRHYKHIALFLLAQMLYMDGLNTLFAFGGIYAAGTFNMNFSQVLEFGIAINITAGLGALSFAWIDDWLGAKRTVLIGLIGLTGFGTSLLFVHSKTLFFVLALIAGLFVGPIQAASRSFMARIAPPELANEMFGLYAFSGKATAFIGPWLLGVVTLFFNSQRAGMSVIMVFLTVGAILLTLVRIY